MHQLGTMLGVFTFALLALTVSGEYCYKDVNMSCSKLKKDTFDNCNTRYSGVEHSISEIQRYTSMHIEQNFRYLLMSAYFNSYVANREGFSKLYHKLADESWEDALDLLKYMAKRGFNMDYTSNANAVTNKVEIKSYKMHELESLAVALDMTKQRAQEAHNIHKKVMAHNTAYHDAEAGQYLEEKFVTKHSQTIRDLSGHANDLQQLIVNKDDPSLAVYLFDEYLQKIVG